MNCPICGSTLEKPTFEEHSNYTLATRPCLFCRKNWILRHELGSIVSATQEGMTMGDFGFDYTCPHCQFQSSVFTSFQAPAGWRCLRCGKIVPNENIKERGDFKLQEFTSRVSASRRGTRKVSTYQRNPRASKPIPTGAVSVATIAQDLKIESKKLRSWLRKVGWRSSDEARDRWLFSPSEAEEVKTNFRR